MIKINTSNFDWKKIHEEYEKIMKDVSDRISVNHSSIWVKVFGSKNIDDGIKNLLYGDKSDLLKYIRAFELAIKDEAGNLNNYNMVAILNSFSKLQNNTKVKNVVINLRESLSNHEANLLDAFETSINHLNADSNRTIKETNLKASIFAMPEYQWYQNHYETLETVFDYPHFTKNYRHTIISAMNTVTCPYCNRQYISNYKSENGADKTSAELDHFYPKSKYPYLALSLYNFIPSCHFCNHNKGDNNTVNDEHSYPYEKGFEGTAKFSIKSDDVGYLIEDNKNFTIQIINATAEPEIEKSIELFKIKELYKNSHNDYVQEIIKNVKMYVNSQIQEYLEEFPELFNNKDEIIRMVFGNYTQVDDLSKRPLSKLTRDILLELGVDTL